MADVIPIGEPVNDAERLAIAHLRDHLPDGYLILHNFEIQRGDEFFEVDLAVLAPHAVYLVDIKGTRGAIEVHGSKWYPEGRQPFTSPLLKLRSHARTLKGIITDSQPGRRDLEGVYVDAVVLLTAPDATLVDPDGRDGPSVTTLAKSLVFFKNAGRIPGRFSKNIGVLYKMVLAALQSAAKPRSAALRFGNWEVLERLGGTDAYTEYRAINLFAGKRAGTVLLRAYEADPYLPEDEREQQRLRIANAYQALNRMPGHPNIVGARDFFSTDSEDRYVLVTEDVPGQALRLYLNRPNLVLTLDQKLRIARELLQALAHAHAHDVVHRNLTPGTLLVGSDGRLRLVGFDFARAGSDRSRTIADEIVQDLEPAYLAPEVQVDPRNAGAQSDIFSAGLILYELFTGEKPFSHPTEIFDQSARFVVPPSQHRGDLPTGLDDWLQSLCAFDADERPSAVGAEAALDALLQPADETDQEAEDGQQAQPDVQDGEPRPEIDYKHLEPNTQLTHKYVVEKRLGKPGSFGVVYKVIDTLGDVSRAIKLILHDRHSTLERLKREYRNLLRVPDHPHIVKVIDADLLPGGGPPAIVFEYVDGLDVGEMVEQKIFTPEDALELARHTAAGLAHLHRHGVHHCDIKPSNLLWTSNGARIIDFNVSIQADSQDGHGGGSRRYLPPDLDLTGPPQNSDLADRDLYALGITLYETITGRYPWETATPPFGRPPRDPRELSGLADLAPEFVDLVLKAIAPRRADRFASATEFLTALSGVKRARRLRVPTETTDSWRQDLVEDGAIPPNTNPYVNRLLTLYSQSKVSNAGTRGLDRIGEQTYVETALDRELAPAVLAGEFRLVIITGNAGDGKTAFLQQLEGWAERAGADLDRSVVNGSRFTLHGRTYLSNYDGSQDEGDRASDEVLRSFFAPFQGGDPDAWSDDDVRLIAINEGRLVDFLSSEKRTFPLLTQIVDQGLSSGRAQHGVTIVNLNRRSVVADAEGLDGSILERLIGRMTEERFWEPCHACDLKARCYAFHNARTFQDETAGPKVVERLQTLYTLTHLRGRLHITLRDLRSALAFMLVGTRTCDEIHELYNAGRRDEIAQGFYFNSWMGGDGDNADRLLSLLKEGDVGASTNPRLDRALSFVSPSDDRSLFRFGDRGDYDREVLRRLFSDLPRNFSGQPSETRTAAHHRYLAMARRRHFFERRDGNWRQMLPYRSAERLLALNRGEEPIAEALPDLIRAINRGEGLTAPDRLGAKLALRVRHVPRGTIRSYRIFPAERFSLAVHQASAESRFVEQMPDGLILRYRSHTGSDAELFINLDIFEMLERLNEGYWPSVEEEQGYYLSLTVFKNLLGSEPYREVLLTRTGHDFYRIERHDDGRLAMAALPMEAA